MQITTTPGGFADLTYYQNQLYVCTTQGEDVVVLTLKTADGTFQEQFRFLCGGNGFARIRTLGASLVLAYRPQSGQQVVVRNLTTGRKRTYDGVFYNWPVVLGANGYAINFGGAAGPTTIYDDAGSVVTILHSGTPTGLARVADDNQSVVTIDDNRGSETDWGLLNPEFAGDVFCGEGMTGGIPLVYQNRDKIILREGTICYVPKITQYGDQWAVVTTDYATASLTYGITAQDFGVVPPPPPPPPPPGGQTIDVQAKVGDQIVIRIVP